MENPPRIRSTITIPMTGMIVTTDKIKAKTIKRMDTTIRNKIMFNIPILFTSANTSPMLNASPILRDIANLASAIIANIPNMINIITAKTAQIPKDPAILSNPAPIAPNMNKRTRVMIIGIMK